MTTTQPEERYAVFETSQKWGYHGTGILSQSQLKKMILESLDNPEAEIQDENLWEAIDAFVERETEAVYEGCSSGIVSVVRLSDGEVWGEQAQLVQKNYHEPMFKRFQQVSD